MRRKDSPHHEIIVVYVLLALCAMSQSAEESELVVGKAAVVEQGLLMLDR